MQIQWYFVAQILYFLLLIGTIIRIIFDTKTPSKTIGYLVIVTLLPIIGMVIYYIFGLNLRKRKLYKNKLITDSNFRHALIDRVQKDTESLLTGSKELSRSAKLIRLMLRTNLSPVTDNNQVEVLINGEEKFPRVLETLSGAQHHIHIEYYIFDDDEVGRSIEQVLHERLKAGVEVRFIYDDFGSRSIRRKMATRLRKAGAEVIPFYKIHNIAFANRLNYRNHRKIIVVDGLHAFVGGINVSEDYINLNSRPDKMYWRDTHLFISGSAVAHLQFLFLNDWNFCSSTPVFLQTLSEKYFPKPENLKGAQQAVQISYSGPDSDAPNILYSIIKAIGLAEKQILITTPYFIPGESLMNTLCIAASTGVDVQLLVPLKGDSIVVHGAAHSYFEQLLEAGVRIFQYHKGFIHAKTFVIDDHLSIVGTANLDIRSFALNFEVNAVVYDNATAKSLSDAFHDDLSSATELQLSEWEKRPASRRVIESFSRILSPVL